LPLNLAKFLLESTITLSLVCLAFQGTQLPLNLDDDVIDPD
jgi:hypothetical protein